MRNKKYKKNDLTFKPPVCIFIYRLHLWLAKSLEH